MPGDETYRLWGEWYDSRRQDVFRIFVRRSVFMCLDTELVRTNRPGSGFFTNTMRPLYADAQAMAVRRLTEVPRRPSLMQLIRQMQTNASILTRERYLSTVSARLGDELDIEFANANFSRIAGGEVDVVPKAAIVAIGADLSKACENVVAYANQAVAHLTETESNLTFGGLDNAIEGVGDAYSRIGVLLEGSYNFPDPVVSPEWQVAFHEGLFT